MKLLSEQECRLGTGLPFEEQQILRSGDYTFLTELGYKLLLNDYVICTANYLLNLFFIRRSYLQFDRRMICAAAIMLSSKITNYKVQESRLRPAKIVSMLHAMLSNRSNPQPYDEKEYLRKLFKAEYKLLKTLECDFEVDLPIDYIDVIVEKLYAGCEDRNMLSTMSRVMANECMRSIAPMCLPVLAVAAASVILAGVICNMPRPYELLLDNPEKWWTYISPELQLEDITRAVSLILEAISLK